MQLIGSLGELMWPRLLQTLDHMQLPGLLSIQTKENNPYYIWINNNSIVAVSRQLDRKGLLWLIHQQGAISFYSANRLAKRCPSNVPLGLYLKSQKILTDSHIQGLFQQQVIHTLYKLIQSIDGMFSFESHVAIAPLEMTGLSLPIYDLWTASSSVSSYDHFANEPSASASPVEFTSTFSSQSSLEPFMEISS